MINAKRPTKKTKNLSLCKGRPRSICLKEIPLLFIITIHVTMKTLSKIKYTIKLTKKDFKNVPQSCSSYSKLF